MGWRNVLRACVLVLGVALVAVACVENPPPPDPTPVEISLDPVTVRVAAGTQQSVAADVPGVARIDSAAGSISTDPALAIEVSSSSGTATETALNVVVNAEPSAIAQHHILSVAAQACATESVPCSPASTRSVVLPLEVEVVARSVVGDGLAIPADGLFTERPDGTAIAGRVVEVVAYPGAAPAAVAGAITSSGGALIGRNESLDLYQALYPSESAATGGRSALSSTGLVFAGDPYVRGTVVADDVIPSDWAGRGEEVRWPFKVTEVSGSLEGQQPAWAYTTGLRSTVVGLVDEGIYVEHEELSSQSSSVVSYVGGGNRVDAFRRGGHGTHVAGTMCGASNGVGVVGVMWDCGLRALDLGSISAWSDFGIVSQIDRFLSGPGVRPRVLNMSFGTRCGIDHAFSARLSWMNLIQKYPDVLFVMSNGNCSNQPANSATVAGSWNSSGFHSVTVAPTTAANTLADFASTGGDISAPGVGIWSSVPACTSNRISSCTSSYAQMSGSSMASPFVAGVAGLAMSANPGLTVETVKSCLGRGTGTSVTPRNSWGRAGGYLIDAESVLNCAAGPYNLSFSNPSCAAYPCTTTVRARSLPANAPVDVRAVCRPQDAAAPQTFRFTTSSTGNLEAQLSLQGSRNAPLDFDIANTFSGCSIRVRVVGESVDARTALLPTAG